MYHEHFGLGTAPFSIAPDPRFLFMSMRHREALAHLLWGLQTDGGFVLLTGEVGTGKTTLSRSLLQQLPEGVELAFVLNPKVTVSELLQTICEELGMTPPSGPVSNKALVDLINARLLDAHAQGRRIVLVVDEAQNLAIDVLEQIRLLTNLETNERKLLQIILLGQPELGDLLNRAELRQLAQRITARFHLDALRPDEMAAYVSHRMMVAGSRRNPFTRGAMRSLHRLSNGIPRLANVIADRALLGAWSAGSDQVSAAVVRRAAAEVRGTSPRRAAMLPWAALGAAALAVAAAGLWWTGVIAPASTAPSPSLPPAAADPGSGPMATPPTAQTMPAVTVSATSALTEPAMAPAIEPETGPARPSEPNPTQPAATPSVVFLQSPEEAWLADLWATSGEAVEQAAFTALTRIWSTPLTPEPGESPCSAVTRVGLSCSRQDGNLRSLLELDRPALLRLWMDGQPVPRSVALLAASEDAVLLASGAETLRTDPQRLNDFWKGEAQILWQMPQGYRYPIANGERSVTVAALRQQLGRAIGTDLGSAELFDDELSRLLAAYQASEGLSPDGIAGPDTWIHLNRHLDTPVPRLSDARSPEPGQPDLSNPNLGNP